MISDVLSDATAEIRRYLTSPTFADIYSHMQSELDDLMARMNAIRRELDKPPFPERATKADASFMVELLESGFTRSSANNYWREDGWTVARGEDGTWVAAKNGIASIVNVPPVESWRILYRVGARSLSGI